MIQEFLTHIASERRFSPLTVRNYREDLLLFDEWHRAKVAEEITKATQEGKTCTTRPEIEHTTSEHIREWIVFRSATKTKDKRRRAASSINRELSTLRSFFGYLRERKIIHEDIFARIGTIKQPKRLPSAVPESRITTILEQTAEKATSHDFEQVRDALIILMFYKCGLRLSELVGINTSDFAPDLTTLKVRGKGDKERLIPIVGSVRTVLNNYFNAINGQNICKSKENALFLTSEGKRISRTKVYRLVRATLSEASVQGKKSPHVLRHTFATQLMNAGADMRDIQELMGHASLRSTQVYTHTSIKQLQEVYAKAHPRRKKV